MSNTVNNFLSAHKLSFRAIRVTERTDGLGDIFPASGPMVNESWAKVENNNRRHFRVEFRTLANDFALSTFFSQGSAHKAAPTAVEVLECLAMDARSVVDAVDVLDFASEFGWELDTPAQLDRLRLVFAGCEETLTSLGALLGSGLDELLALNFDEDEDE